MLENAIELLRISNSAFASLSSYLSLSDAEVLSGKFVFDDSVIEQSAALSLIKSIANRDLFVRAFAFGPTLIAGKSESGTDAWWRLRPFVLRGRSHEALELQKLIAIRAKRYLTILGHGEHADTLDVHHLVIDLPNAHRLSKNTRLFIGDEAFGVRLYNELFKVDRWAEAFENRKIVGYVYCPLDYAYAVHLAARDVMKETADIEFDEWSWKLTKLSPELLAARSTVLSERGEPTTPVRIPSMLTVHGEYLRS